MSPLALADRVRLVSGETGEVGTVTDTYGDRVEVLWPVGSVPETVATDGGARRWHDAHELAPLSERDLLALDCAACPSCHERTPDLCAVHDLALRLVEGMSE